MFGAVSAFQSAACRILSAEDPRDALTAALNSIPPARTRLEELIIYGLVLESALLAAGRTVDAAGPTAKRGVDLLFCRRNCRPYHDDMIALRVAQRIIDHYDRPCDLRTLARAAACHETSLRRAFRHRFGMSIREYHGRVRVCAAVREFAAGTHNVLAVARSVGYRTEKNFYRAVARFAGLTPAELRDADNRCIPATCQRLMGCGHQSAAGPWCAVHRMRAQPGPDGRCG
jgi:AraC-like DNA-binding protein